MDSFYRRIIFFYFLSHSQSEIWAIYSKQNIWIKISYSFDGFVYLFIADPCDSVQATLVQNDYPAQWLDENNNLNGGSNSCEAINLELLTYPQYSGESYETEADNKVIALDPWKLDGYGVGT